MVKKLFILLLISVLFVTEFNITAVASEQQETSREQEESEKVETQTEEDSVSGEIENTTIESPEETIEDSKNEIDDIDNVADTPIVPEIEEKKQESNTKELEPLGTNIPKVTFSMAQTCSMNLYDYKEIPVYTYINGTKVSFSNDGEAKWGDYTVSLYSMEASCQESVAEVFGYDCYSGEQPNISIVTKGKVSTVPVSVNISYSVIVPEYNTILGYTEYNYYEYNYKMTMNLKTSRYKKMWARTWISNYNTRKNVFYMKVQNLSNKTITVYSSSAKAFDCDYKRFDRKLKLTKNKKKISIKPGKTVTVKFKVRGKVTWYDYDDFEICSYWKWGKKKYWVSVSNGYPPYRRSGKRWKVCGAQKD